MIMLTVCFLALTLVYANLLIESFVSCHCWHCYVVVRTVFSWLEAVVNLCFISQVFERIGDHISSFFIIFSCINILLFFCDLFACDFPKQADRFKMVWNWWRLFSWVLLSELHSF